MSSYSYPVMETFYSIQGEGFFQGHAAFFIRLAGCDVGCVWCDVKESWDAKAHSTQTVATLVNEVKSSGANLVIITGGEPLMYDCTPLTEALHEAGVQVNIETSGAYPLSGIWDWICVSPKKFKAPLPEILAKANELKIVLFNQSDFKWAEQHAEKVQPTCKLYLQPEWSKEDVMLPLINDYILAQPKWILSLQIHKYMGVR
jgi:7-carboxy-7-deazaguanine synthase